MSDSLDNFLFIASLGRIVPEKPSALRKAIIDGETKKLAQILKSKHPDTINKGEGTHFTPLITAITNPNCSDEIVELLLEKKASLDLRENCFILPIYLCTKPKFVELLLKYGSEQPESTFLCFLCLLKLKITNFEIKDEIFDYWIEIMKKDSTIEKEISKLHLKKFSFGRKTLFNTIPMPYFHKFVKILIEFHPNSIGTLFYSCIYTESIHLVIYILENFKIDVDSLQYLTSDGNREKFFIIDEICCLDKEKRDVFLYKESFKSLIDLGVKPGENCIKNWLKNHTRQYYFSRSNYIDNNREILSLFYENGATFESNDLQMNEGLLFLGPLGLIDVTIPIINWNENSEALDIVIEHLPVSFLSKIINEGKLDKDTLKKHIDTKKYWHKMEESKYKEEMIVYLIKNYSLQLTSSELLSISPTIKMVEIIIENKIQFPETFVGEFAVFKTQNVELLQLLYDNGVTCVPDVCYVRDLLKYPITLKFYLQHCDISVLSNSFAREGNLMHYSVCYIGSNTSSHHAKFGSIDSTIAILDSGWDINKKCCGNKNPLAHALKRNDHELFVLLLDRNADINVCVENDMGSLVSDKRIWKLVSLLNKQKFDVEKSKRGESVPEIFSNAVKSPRKTILLALINRLPENQIQLCKNDKNLLEFALKSATSKITFTDDDISIMCEIFCKLGLSVDDIENVLPPYCDGLKNACQKCIEKIKLDSSRRVKSATK